MRIRSGSVAVFFMLLGMVVLYFLADRMIVEKDRYFRSGYIDKTFVELMDMLIAEGIFREEGNRVIVDEKLLKEKRLRKKTEDRVLGNLPYLYVRNGRVFFDHQSVSISNNRILADERILRGSFFDRNGVLLAGSAFDERMWRQQRDYTYGPEFFHITGYSSQIFGKKNLEKELDDYLAGRNHLPVYKKTADPLKDIQLGDNVTLTLNSAVQRRSYELMKDKKGAVVVLDVRTGEIITAVSTPSFDPNENERDNWRNVYADNKEKAYENRAFSVLYPPGSTFKTVVASAWLEERGKKYPRQSDYKVFCNARKNKYDISDIHAHGKMDFKKAYADSCNIFFSEIGVMLGEDLLDYSNRFGFNRKINLIPQLKDHPFNAEASRAFIWNGDKEKEFMALAAVDFKRNPKLVAQGAIGQNLVSATPLQLALVAATIANKGILLNPFIVKEIRTGDGKKALFLAKPVEIGRAVKEETAAEIRGLMERVMLSGTGKDVKRVYREGWKYTTGPKSSRGNVVAVAGKTGTAEVGDRNGNGKIDADEKPHSWFIGFAPAGNPRFAIAVIAENQGFGSLTAAPIAMEVLAEALNAK